MMADPSMVFSTDPRYGLVARSGWEQEEARTVLRDLGWVWEEELHALVQPDNVSAVEAGVQAVEELHLHGHHTGYSMGPYGPMLLTLDRAETVITKEVGCDTLDGPTPEMVTTGSRDGSHLASTDAVALPPQEPDVADEFEGPSL
ncbi:MULTISPECIES: hypothetical protein [Streptomyces]|uniref:Uncharacterized protein n=1 Tax=Streptomyces glycanivorans TaxID=3033808 RepID=A0ABY9JG01_9ACTN|nr:MULTISPECIES: hypothetical protein [Streptomyces]MBL1285627.1 hypothetical protein [Streptomyces silvae]WLQ66632.1 hypothetical protein P8A20_25010 [Streptomyces sp. Alt3]